MDEILKAQYGDEEWPDEAERMYERVEVLGRGSFGVVWMARRVVPPENDYDDEYVALKNIEIKENKGRVYAQREISILTELRHPNVIRLVRAFPVYQKTSQLVALQMARGPNLQYLVTKRGALGLPLSRLVARHLVAAVSYLHGRGVIHRDIKPTNCILENTQLAPQDIYDWIGDDRIWSDGKDAETAVDSGKYKLMLVDFGFARALEEKEVTQQPSYLRGSIAKEALTIDEIAKLVADDYGGDDEVEEATKTMRRASITNSKIIVEQNEEIQEPKRRVSTVSIPVPFQIEEGSNEDASELEGAPSKQPEPVPEDKTEMEKKADEAANSPASNGNARQPRRQRSGGRRQSTTRTKLRSMSALGTKAYAAPEIKHQLRHKTEADLEQSKEALTECVADYGMIVDAFSVGWTLRVVMTGIPPNVTISQYMKKISIAQEQVGETGCLCFKTTPPKPREIKVRDVSDIPTDATLLITLMTKKSPEERMTVREAQNHPYIKGRKGEKPYDLPQGDYPARHGDPVVFLKCAGRSYSAAVPNMAMNEKVR